MLGQAKPVRLVLVLVAAAAVGLFSEGRTPQTALAQPLVYAVSGVGTGSGPSDLYAIAPTASGADTLIGRITSGGWQPLMTDIALAPAGAPFAGTLFGASFTTLYSIDTTTAIATPITTLEYSGTAESATTYTLTDNDANSTANQFVNDTVVITGGTGADQNRTIYSNTINTLSVSPAWGTIPDATSTFEIREGLGVYALNALGFSSSGQLFGATGGAFVTIDPSTGQATIIGPLGSGLTSSGDLAFAPTRTLYGSAKDTTARPRPDVLVTINPATGVATRVSANNKIGINNVFGLFFDGLSLFGLTAETPRCSNNGALISINLATGKGTFVRCLSFDAFGATTPP